MTLLLVLYALLPLLLLVGGGGIGRWQERRHIRSLVEREQAVGGVTVTNLRGVPAGTAAADPRVVVGEVVIASDYAKQFFASIRTLFGGEVRSLQRLLDRGRREALLRAIGEAQAHRADMLVNVRFETSSINRLSSEIVCYATAVRTM